MSTTKHGNRLNAQLFASAIALQQLAATAPVLANNPGNHGALASGAIGNWHAATSHVYAPASPGGQGGYHAQWAPGGAQFLPASFGLGVTTLPSVSPSLSLPLSQTNHAFAQAQVQSTHSPKGAGGHAPMVARSLVTNQSSLIDTASLQVGQNNQPRQSVQLDLTSASNLIVLDAGTINHGTAVTVNVGGGTVSYHAGDKITAGELVAIEQAQTKGGQHIVLDAQGRAIGGSFSLNSVGSPSGYSITSVVVPANVTAVDRVTLNSNIKIDGDLTNYGSILEIGKGSSASTANITALDITNEAGGSVTSRSLSALNLTAVQDFTNKGTISSSGTLSISAGGTITNKSSITSAGDLTFQAPNIVNAGTVVSSTGNINLGTAGDQGLTVSNSHGTLSAANGAINVRDASYNGLSDTTLTGGNLLSQQLNLNAGGGTTNVNVGELTGTVTSTGNAVHVEAATQSLVIGSQNLTGDPTYFNDNGGIVIDGNIVVAQSLAIIASGDITATSKLQQIQAQDGTGQGYDITIVAGANVTTGSANSTSGIPGTNALGTVTFSGGSATGGSVDFSGAASNLAIDASSTINAKAGNITLAAYVGGANTGAVLLPPTSLITSVSKGSTYGNVTILAGGAKSGQAIVIGDIIQGGGAVASNIGVYNYQPTSSNSKIPALSFDTTGAISSGNTLAPDFTKVGSGSVSVGSLDAVQNISVSAGADLTLTNTVVGAGSISLTARGAVNLFSVSSANGMTIVAGKDVIGSANTFLTTNSTAQSSANLSVIAGAAFSESATAVTVTGASTTGGTIDLTAGGGISTGSPTVGVVGGNVLLAAYAGLGSSSGAVKLGALESISTGTGNSSVFAGRNGTVTILGGANNGSAIEAPASIDVAGTMGNIANISLYGAQPTGTILISKSGSGTASVAPGALTGGAIDVTGAVFTLNLGNLILATAGDIIGQSSVSGSVGVLSVAGHAVIAPGNDSKSFNGNYFIAATGDVTIDTDIEAFNIAVQTSGSINLTAGLTNLVGLVNLALVAGNDIVTGKGSSVNVSVQANPSPGNLVIIAGAAASSAINNVSQSDVITITGASAKGGNIDFATNAISSLTSAQGVSSDITLAAFSAAGVNGAIKMPAALTITTGVGGAASGNVTIVADGSIGQPGSPISVDTSGGNAGTGNITLSLSTPNATVANPLIIDFNNGGVTGSLLNGALASGAVNYGTLVTSGATISISQGNSLSISSTLDANSSLILRSAGDVTTSTALSNPSIALLAGGNVNIGGSLTAPSGLLILAGGNVVTTAPGLSIDTSSTSISAGAVTIGAGAAFTVSGSTITVTGASSTGGNIDLVNGANKLAIFSAGASGATGDGGAVNLFSFANAGNNNGLITLPSTGDISATSASGNGGQVNITAGAPLLTAINIGNVTTTGFVASGAITFSTSAPSVSSTNSLTLNADGSISSGNPNLGTTFNNGDIIAGTLTSTGGAVTINAGGNVQILKIDVGGDTNILSGGVVTVAAGSPAALLIGGSIATGSNFIGSIVASGYFQFIESNAGKISLQSGSGGLKIADANAINLAFENNPGSLTLNAGTGVLDLGPLTSLNFSQGADSAGNVSLTGSDIQWASKGSSAFSISADGTAFGKAGTITINVTGTNTLSIGSLPGDLTLSANTPGNSTFSGGTISVSTPNTSVKFDSTALDVSGGGGGGIILLSSKGFLGSSSGPVTLKASAGSSGNGGSITLQDLAVETLTLGSAASNFVLDVSSASGNAGTATVSSAANLTYNTGGLVTSASLAGATLSLTAGANLLINGNISVGSSTANGGSLTLVSNSATPFTIGGTKLVNGIAGQIDFSAPNGTPGSISITNSGGSIVNAVAFNGFSDLSETAGGAKGSVTVSKNLGTAATNVISLTAKGSGSVVASAATVSANTVNLNADTGAITVSKLLAASVSAATTTGKTGVVTITSINPVANPLSVNSATGAVVKITTPGELDLVNNITGGAVTLTSTAKTGALVNLAGNVVATGAVTIAGPGVIDLSGIQAPGGITITNKDTANPSLIKYNGDLLSTAGAIKVTSTGGIWSGFNNDVSGAKGVVLTAKGVRVGVDGINIGKVGANAITPTFSATSGISVEFINTIAVSNSATLKSAGYIVIGSSISGTSAKSVITLTAGGSGTIADDNGGNYTISGGTVSLSAPGSISLASTALTATTKALTVTSAKDTINLGSAASTLTASLGSIAVSAANGIALSGAVTATTGLTATLTSKTASGDITFNLTAPISVSAATGKVTITSTKAINIDSSITSGSDVTLKSTGGDINLTDNTTSTAGKVSVTALDNISNNGTITAATAITLASTVAGTAPPVTAITLNPSSRLNVTGASGTVAVTTASGSINGTAGSTIDASKSVTLTAAKGGITADSIGATTAPATITVTSLNDTSLNGPVNSSGSITVKVTGSGHVLKIFDSLQAAKDLTLTSSGDINVDPVSILSSTTGKAVLTAVNNINDFGSINAVTSIAITTTLKTATTALTVGNLTASNGSIAVIGAGQLVATTSGDTISATGASSKTKATILIEASNTIDGSVTVGGTIGTHQPGGSTISISVGAPGTGKNALASGDVPNLFISNTDSGKVFGGANPGAIQVPTGSALAGTIGAVNVILSSPNVANKITFLDAASVIADPPSSSALSTSQTPVIWALQSPAITPGISRVDVSQLPPVLAANLSSLPAPIPASSPLLNTGSTVYTLDNSQVDIQTGFSSGPGLGSFAHSSPANWISATETTGGAIPAELSTDCGKISLTDKSLLLAPQADSSVDTICGRVNIKAKSLVLLMPLGGGVAIYNLHDSGKKSVVVTVGQVSLPVAPGHCAVVVDKNVRYFETINPAQLVCYGKIGTVDLGDFKAFHSAFSAPSMVNAVPALGQLIISERAEHKKAAAAFLKTTSIMMQLRGGFNDFHQIRRPEMTAYNN
jgi:fibronectin-binding autotransporter adhesin